MSISTARKCVMLRRVNTETVTPYVRNHSRNETDKTYQFQTSFNDCIIL